MTCREFAENAELITPVQLRLLQAEGDPMLSHARECGACGKWLESQQLLGSALHVLRDQTAQREASPEVELAVLRAFRMQNFEPVTVIAPERAAPAAWKLSRIFEIGAYAAVAAALIVGVFLGTRMWTDKHAAPNGGQAQAVQTPSQVAPSDEPNNPTKNGITEVAQRSGHLAASSIAPATKRTHSATEQDSTTGIDRQGFVALMFCDPLICSGEEQVIRMELPGSGVASAEGNASQPVIADVIVGDDGLVRAMRIVN